MDIGARAGDARLPRRREDARQHACLRLIQVRVVEHDVRALAAQLQHAADQPLSRARGDRAAGADAAGERHLRDERMIDERLPRLAEAADDVDDARRNAGELPPASPAPRPTPT